ncbi:diphthine--ammonia ligase [Virgibacillus sp. MSP4-1]|uniref:Dph6-related ATP pyrophosphatase n=1 Tax=Virgibacillus sp. MSP4-1 TaxID=2700081 RepID=UPI0005C74DE4|nr:diphthine--ammonia ligase [Virgibacillus sp. MSP4-1]QHS21916.1 diphthine--ammonia ligase [Virgibacillus sp. MSP4-1]
MKKKIAISFSGGKDSILALNRIITSNEWDVCCLVTTITEESQRTTMHSVREALLDEQASALNIPLQKVYIPQNCPNDKYEKIMGRMMEQLISDDVTHMMFGDIQLGDIRKFRENMLKSTPIQPVFPIWGEDTKLLIHEFLSEGFQTIVTCTDGHQLDSSFTGKVVNRSFLNDLPSHVDPCGENGEFHTFVFDGPLFKHSIRFRPDETLTVQKDLFTGGDRFYYTDLVPYL